MPKPSRRAVARAVSVPAAIASVVACAFAASPAVAAPSSDAFTIPAVKPAWATAATDRGVVAADATVRFEVPLALQDEAGAEAFALAASTPGTPQYRQFLAPADWIARFAPTRATFDAATAALAAEGMQVLPVQPASREYVLVAGTAAQIDATFRTSLHTYRASGEVRIAATGTVTLPRALARHASAPVFGRAPMRSMLVQPDRTAMTGSCSTYWDQHRVAIPTTQQSRTASTALCGYTPKQLRATAGLDAKGAPQTRGTGQTIAVIDAFGSPTMAADLVTFDARNHLSAASYREIVPDAAAWQQTADGCDAASWQPEQTLDLEAAHSIAPAAQLLYVGATDCDTGFDVALSTVLDQGLASIVSNSYGSLEEPIGADVQLHQQLQAAGEGIGLFYASGDTGDNSDVNSTGQPSVGFPASSPWVTAVGGTAVALDKHGKRVFTLPWGDSLNGVAKGRSKWLIPMPGVFADSGAGGGASDLFQRPGYQVGVVPMSLSDGSRTTTDVSALADPVTGFRIGYRKHPWSRYATATVGGTSLATPIVAAEAALAQQQAGGALGFLNPAAYAHRAAFADVKPSSKLRIVLAQSLPGGRLFMVLGHDGTLKARKGYDLPTGLGTLTPATLTALAR